MEIAKNRTEFTKRVLSAFQNMEILKKSWLVCLCSLVLIVLSFTIREGKIVLNSIPFLIIGVCVVPVYVMTLKVLFIKQNKKFEKTTLNYIFTDQKILVSGQSATSKEDAEFVYTNLQGVKNTRRYIYLYINKMSALVVDKNGFTSGSAEKLLSLLDLRLSKKNLK